MLNTGRVLAAWAAPCIGSGGMGGAGTGRRWAGPAGLTDLDFGNSGHRRAADDGLGCRQRYAWRAWLAMPRCRRRPMGRVLDPLVRMGVEVAGWRTVLCHCLCAAPAICCRSNISCRWPRPKSSLPFCWQGCTPRCNQRDRDRKPRAITPERMAAPLRRRGDDRRARTASAASR